LSDFKPTVPEAYRKSQFVYLANNDPEQNTSLIKEFDKVKFSMCDTIDFWISTKREAVIKMIKAVDAVVINDEEAKLLTKEFNLIKCAKKMMEWGAKYVIIKKGEHGSLMFYDDVIFPTAGFSLEDVVDPTGAGDSFAGAMIGYLASKKSTSISEIKKAVVYGNILGSFAVEKYGLDGLLKIKNGDISKRIKIYEKMIRF
ncbi:MAG: bifunctional hydroxymethylpyrimidine kinase/phosphomethylpyrimidine kinase, partial [Thaumarchaeota archaeon]|nr:bifunctional hydroxymethylpyrimidine kinase/phosphomethylpyrimidine kinase [Nitrososphaerota archaeon]